MNQFKVKAIADIFTIEGGGRGAERPQSARTHAYAGARATPPPPPLIAITRL